MNISSLKMHALTSHSRVALKKRFCEFLARRSYIQKHLILSNLKELHATFKNSYPDIKTCFSNFCSHHPKCCITVKGTSDAHTIVPAPTIKMLS